MTTLPEGLINDNGDNNNGNYLVYVVYVVYFVRLGLTVMNSTCFAVFETEIY